MSCLLVSCIHRRHVTFNILTCSVYCFFFFFKWWPYAFRICSNNGTSTDVFPCKISSSLNKYSTGTESKNTHHKTKTTKQQNNKTNVNHQTKYNGLSTMRAANTITYLLHDHLILLKLDVCCVDIELGFWVRRSRPAKHRASIHMFAPRGTT